MNALVLVVDADPDRLRIAERLVQAEGSPTITATDARDAMLLFFRREPRVTVLHVDASDDAGLKLCRDMKTLRTGRRRAVVVVAPRELRMAAFEAGCDAFVTEATDGVPIRRAVRRLLSAGRDAAADAGIEVVA